VVRWLRQIRSNAYSPQRSPAPSLCHVIRRRASSSVRPAHGHPGSLPDLWQGQGSGVLEPVLARPLTRRGSNLRTQYQPRYQRRWVGWVGLPPSNAQASGWTGGRLALDVEPPKKPLYRPPRHIPLQALIVLLISLPFVSALAPRGPKATNQVALDRAVF
jgi:hypothetical protein